MFEFQLILSLLASLENEMVKVDRTVRSEMKNKNAIERAQETRLNVLNFIEELNEGMISLTRTWHTAFTKHKKVKPKNHERSRS